MTYPLASIKSGHDEMAGIWISVGFSSEDRELDVLHIVGGDPVSPQHAKYGYLPIYLERYDQALSCYQGAEQISVDDASLTVTLTKKAQDALHLPQRLHFECAKIDDDFRAAREIFKKMQQYESGKIIHVG